MGGTVLRGRGLFTFCLWPYRYKLCRRRGGRRKPWVLSFPIVLLSSLQLCTDHIRTQWPSKEKQVVQIDTLIQISSFKTAYKEGRLNCLSQASPAEGIMGIGPADAEASDLDVVPSHLELFAYKANRKVQTFLLRPWQRGTWKTDAFSISWFSLSVLHSPGQDSPGQQSGCLLIAIPLTTSPAFQGHLCEASRGLRSWVYTLFCMRFVRLHVAVKNTRFIDLIRMCGEIGKCLLTCSHTCALQAAWLVGMWRRFKETLGLLVRLWEWWNSGLWRNECPQEFHAERREKGVELFPGTGFHTVLTTVSEHLTDETGVQIAADSSGQSHTLTRTAEMWISPSR